MKLCRRTRWKPKQKLRKEDIQFLLAEYRIEKSRCYVSISWSAVFFSIFAVTFIAIIANPAYNILRIIATVGMAGGILSAFNGDLHRYKASQIGEVLEIKKRLERYGVD